MYKTYAIFPYLRRLYSYFCRLVLVFMFVFICVYFYSYIVFQLSSHSVWTAKKEFHCTGKLVFITVHVTINELTLYLNLLNESVWLKKVS